MLWRNVHSRFKDVSSGRDRAVTPKSGCSHLSEGTLGSQPLVYMRKNLSVRSSNKSKGPESGLCFVDRRIKDNLPRAECWGKRKA